MTNILKNFWVLEGLDGSGTTTQLKMIEKELNKRNIKNFITQEPTTNETGTFLRKVLKGEIQVNQSTIAHLFSADRDDHIFNAKYGIVKHLDNKELVVSDRYMFSSLAYQSIGFPYSKVHNLNKDFPYPEYVIFIDTPIDECINRINKRGEQKEIYEKFDYQKKVLKGYKKCLNNLPKGCTLVKIDGTKSREEIFNEIKEQLIDLL